MESFSFIIGEAGGWAGGGGGGRFKYIFLLILLNYKKYLLIKIEGRSTPVVFSWNKVIALTNSGMQFIRLKLPADRQEA